MGLVQALLEAPLVGQNITLDTISTLDTELYCYFASRINVDTALTRSLVSFQDSRNRPRYRWYKFKEAFSPSLVEYLLSLIGQPQGRLLDPFAGSGTALFSAKGLGWDTTGIELLPIGQTLIESRTRLEEGYSPEEIEILYQWAEGNLWQPLDVQEHLPELRITKGAYPAETHIAIEQYLEGMRQESERI